MSRVYSLVLQEESHKNIGYGAAGSSQSDTMAMYTNSKGNFNSNWNKGNDKAMVVTNQCPISKTQCKQLLAFLNSGSTYSGADFGDASHAASVSSSCMYTGVEGLTGMASDVVGTSASPNLNTNAAFMSRP
nr:hypothetical protein CFP56_51993 [Quercus suber]